MAYLGPGKTNVQDKVSETYSSATSTGGDVNFDITFNHDYVDVFINGIKLQKYTDYTPNSNNTVTLVEETENGDVVECYGYYAYNLEDDYITLQNFESLENYVNTTVNNLIQSVNTSINNSELYVNTSVANLTSYVDTSVANLTSYVNTSVSNVYLTVNSTLATFETQILNDANNIVQQAALIDDVIALSIALG